ncbi:MAG: beta-propeller fold lactonase family protein [Rhodospirillaceae bacterium]
MAVGSSDGCTVLVSLIAGDKHSVSGVAVLRRANGLVGVDRVAAVPGVPTGMILTHDGKTLIVANGAGVVFISFERLVAGGGDPILGHVDDVAEVPPDTARYLGPQLTSQVREAGSNQVIVTVDDRFLFVADEWAQAITVIDLMKGFSEASVVGRIPVGVLPLGLAFSRDEKLLFSTSQIGLREYDWPTECKAEGANSRQAAINPQGALMIIDVSLSKKTPREPLLAERPQAVRRCGWWCRRTERRHM